MFLHYVDLAWRSFRRDRWLTLLMVVAIGLGVGASMTTLTILHVLSGDPIPAKSDRLFRVLLDMQSLEQYGPGDAIDEQLTRFDAETLLRTARARRQVMMVGGRVVLVPERADLKPFHASARYVSADFFPMFDVPLVDGTAWTAEEDEARARVVVIAKPLANKLFGGERAVGRALRLDEHELRIIGVIDDWRPTPRFYDLQDEKYGETELIYLPFSTFSELGLDRVGGMTCWSDDVETAPTALTAKCSWIQYWAELESPGQVDDYRRYLNSYVEEQRRAGRVERPDVMRVYDVMGWLDYKRVVPSDVRLQVYLAFGFLAVCLLNTVGLLLAKFLRRSSEIGVRRALGAPKPAIFAQFLIEALAIGLLGGVLGLGLTVVGLQLARAQPSGYEHLMALDGPMLITTFVVALGASALAGIFPAWRACNVAPGVQLKQR